MDISPKVLRGFLCGVFLFLCSLAGVWAMSEQNQTGKQDWYELSKEMIKRHEGFSPTPYTDTMGHLTIGYGCKLPLTIEDGEALLEARMRIAFHDAAHLFKGFGVLDEVRTAVLVDMSYQLGYDGLEGFVKFREAVAQRDWVRAHGEMLNSRWAQQVPGRALELADLMLKGEE